MKRQYLVEWGVGLIALFILFVLAMAFIFQDQVIAQKDHLQAVSSLVSIFGVFALLFALLQYVSGERERRRTRNVERVRTMVEFMNTFYNAPELAEIKKHLRDQTEYKRPPSAVPGYSSLRDDEVQVMNFFETLAFAVEEGVLDIALVYRMLGSPIAEMQRHPTMKQLLESKFSYEGVTQVLIPRLNEYRAKRAG
jgi:hypothetical protein